MLKQKRAQEGEFMGEGLTTMKGIPECNALFTEDVAVSGVYILPKN